MIVVLFGVFFVNVLSESKADVGLYVNFCANLVLLLIWGIAMLLFKVNSSSKFVWGYTCSHLDDTTFDYNYFCTREVNQLVDYTN